MRMRKEANFLGRENKEREREREMQREMKETTDNGERLRSRE